MLIKGEKYACEACVRGHRVTSCQHSERPLQHINKKGRPVSQCTHCRTLRKSRSAHVRCDCGEKAHTKAGCEGDTQDNCCCSHGARCSCALKKEHLDPVPESDSDEASSTSASTANEKRPRALTAQSETGLTVFANGHHKPAHKHNNMASKCGLPYVVPRAHTIHGQSHAGLANRSVDNLPHTNTIDALHSNSHIKDSMVSAQQEQRMAKSEHGSPLLSPATNLDVLNSQLPPLDLSTLSGDYNFMQFLDTNSAVPDMEQPMFSAGLSSASIDWSHYDGLDFNNFSNDNFAPSNYSQAPSFTGFEFANIEQPSLTTTSTSGEISEVEDFIPFTENNSRPNLLNHHYGSDYNSDFVDEVDTYRLSTASSYIGMPQVQMLASNNLDSLDIDAFIKAAQGQIPNPSYLSHHGLPTSWDNSNIKTGPTNSPYTENTSPYTENNYQNLAVDDDNDVFWMNSYASHAIPNGGHSDLPENNVWAE